MDRFSILLLSSLPAIWALTHDDGTGRLPAMGWNSWNAYHCDVDETKMMAAANDIVQKGFQTAGYNYVILDDCWSIQSGRDPNTNRIQPNTTKFPDGIDGWVSKVHDLGLKTGIYSSAGEETCGGYPASLGYETIDATTFAEWGIDYLKYDNCGVPDSYNEECYSCNADYTYATNLVNGTCLYTTVQKGASNMMPICLPVWPVDGRDYSQSNTSDRYNAMRDALAAQNRTILFSLCNWGTDEVYTWANNTGNSWRMSNDIQPTWADITRILNMNSFLGDFTDFFGHNDPDMLEVGNGDITPQETRTHFALWSLMKAPLLIGTDITQLSQDNIDILQNEHLIAFNQDSIYGKPAVPYKWGTNPDWTFNATNPAEFWAGQSTKGTVVALFNSLNASRTMTLDYAEIPGLESDSYSVLNAWTGEDLGCKQGPFDMTVDTHDTAVYLLQNAC
ncbi:hypothetical protein PRZ48_008637 [Zasmidium cellare]|uniref:Alpha-galactosidase n=1 Tax=Zasmidium cellare TaxID=395010 RepID=A0ABR0EGW5_ZASCE|nr:hypothetical protein PRZ48_008637 [Zasmidium cellare]